MWHHDSDAHCSARSQDPALTWMGDSHTWLQGTVVSQLGTSFSSHFCTSVSALHRFPFPHIFVIGNSLNFLGVLMM